MKIYYRLVTIAGCITRYASTDKDTVINQGYPIYLQHYRKERTKQYVLNDTLAFLSATYGNNIELVDVDEKEKK